MHTHLPRVVWFAVSVGVAARLAFSFGYWVDKPLTDDEREYLLLARYRRRRPRLHLRAAGLTGRRAG